VELVLISNEAGRERFLDQSRIHRILAPTIQVVCHVTPAQTTFFPSKIFTSTGALPQQGRHPACPIPMCPAIMPTIGAWTPNTPSRGQYSGPPSNHIPNLGQIRSHRLPRKPLQTVELCGGLATGLEAILIAGYAICSDVWVDIDPDAHMVVSNRITHLRLQISNLLPPEALTD
jgi:hypothetical protein